MRKFLMNGALLSSVFGVISVVRQTAGERRTWKVVLLWAAWAISVAIAIAAVIDERDEEREKTLDGLGAR